jgi:hypothetical protein
MAGSHYPDAHPRVAGEAHRGHHVRGTAGNNNERGLLVGGQVPGPARLVVALLAWRVRRAAQTRPQSLESRTLDHRLHNRSPF